MNCVIKKCDIRETVVMKKNMQYTIGHGKDLAYKYVWIGLFLLGNQQ